jgi:hypothetical protein
MNILWPDIHKSLTKSIATSFERLGYNLILPSEEYSVSNYPPSNFSQFVWATNWNQEKADNFFNTKNIKVLNKQEILDLKPEVIFITNFESQFEILKEIWPVLKDKSKIACYSGNDYWDGAYPLNFIKNYLCADYTGYLLSNKYNLHYLYYKPWVFYDELGFSNPRDGNIVGIYISEYQKNFKKEFDYSLYLKERSPFVDYHYHTKSNRKEILQTLHKSIATQHIKGLEGYGIAIIESMATGNPVFLHRQLSKNKSLLQWSIENKTAFFFDTEEEYINKLKSLIESRDYRYYIQSTTANTIRQIIDNETETEKLKFFIENLR